MSDTLLLDKNYAPVGTISWQKAITLLFKGKIEVLQEHSKELRSATVIIKMPSVVRLINALRRPMKRVRFSREAVYLRDNFECCYCGVKLTFKNATFDHVIPRAQGGNTTFDNIVTSCYRDNNRKGNRTPDQAGMKLLKKPFKPDRAPIMYRFNKDMPNEWSFWITE